MNPRRRLACAAGLSFLVAGLTGCDVDDPVLTVGQGIRHDDFRYTVLGVQVVARIGERRPVGRLLVVHFEVANEARRVEHRWSNRVAYLVDASGRVYENDAAWQQALEAEWPFGWAPDYVTRAGATQRTMLVYDLPDTASRPIDLKVRGELLMGDVLDGAQFRRARVRLR